jgi:hypothetical protein
MRMESLERAAALRRSDYLASLDVPGETDVYVFS